MSAFEKIRKNHRKRHSHEESNDNRCKHCGSFVSKPEPRNNQVKYTCMSCGRAILEYVPQKATAD